MAYPVLVRRQDGGWKEPEITSYGSEAELQRLVKESPDLLTGTALATVDEFYIPGIGSVDIVGIGADGAITIVECKLRANPEIRREVVGQLLAYAGGLWQMGYDEFASGWQSRAGAPLVEHVTSTLELEHSTDLAIAVADSLQRGEFTLLIAVDEITSELKRIIEYLNAMTRDSVTVLGLELQYVKESGTEILIPRTYGESSAAAKRKSAASGTKWNSETFAEATENLSDAERGVVQALMEHGEGHGIRPWWGVGQVPGMSWYYRVGQSAVTLFQIQLRSTGAVVVANVGGLAVANGLGERTALQMAKELKAIPSIAPHLDHVTESNLNRYPPIPVAGALDQSGAIDSFLAAIDRVRLAPQA